MSPWRASPPCCCFGSLAACCLKAVSNQCAEHFIIPDRPLLKCFHFNGWTPLGCTRDNKKAPSHPTYALSSPPPQESNWKRLQNCTTTTPQSFTALNMPCTRWRQVLIKLLAAILTVKFSRSVHDLINVEISLSTNFCTILLTVDYHLSTLSCISLHPPYLIFIYVDWSISVVLLLLKYFIFTFSTTSKWLLFQCTTYICI